MAYSIATTKEEKERLRGEGERVNFVGFGFERRQTVSMILGRHRKARRSILGYHGATFKRKSCKFAETVANRRIIQRLTERESILFAFELQAAIDCITYNHSCNLKQAYRIKRKLDLHFCGFQGSLLYVAIDSINKPLCLKITFAVLHDSKLTVSESMNGGFAA